jgi:hypothetical protein
VCVDVSNAPEFPGYVRTVTLHDGNEVVVELNTHGYDEGGPTFTASFASLDDAIESLEDYFGKPLEHWGNFSRTGEYPEPLPDQDLDEGHKRLEAAIASNRVPLPRGPFRLKEGYWSK